MDFSINLAHQKLLNLIHEKYSPDQRVMDAFKNIKREHFVSKGLKSRAYNDVALAISYGQTISQPSLVAKMTDIALNGRKTPLENVLEIGTGSGFQAAILSVLSKRVYTIERIKQLVNLAKENTLALNLKNIYFLEEWEFDVISNLKFDAIIFSAGYTGAVPNKWLNLLAINGVLVCPYRKSYQNDSSYILTRFIRTRINELETKKFMDVSFVPYIETE